MSPRDLAAYQTPDARRSTWQLVHTLVPYLLVHALMFAAVPISPWLALPLAPLAGGLLVRLFIIFHDCGHGSFYRSRRANDIVGFLTGVITLTPHKQWWREHSIHHATAGDLDRRGSGDVWTMTVEEYLAASRWTRLVYWFVRNPAFMFTVGPFIMFWFVNRIPAANARRREKIWLAVTNLTLLGLFVGLGLALGFGTVLLVEAMIYLVAGAAGVWLFYVQHNFEDVYWARRDAWEYPKVGMVGSSFYRLPRILQWFSGNIGFHHVHHLNPRIPNYRLEACHRENPELHSAPVLTLRSALATLRLRLWDEATGRMVGFDHVRGMRRNPGARVRAGA